MGKPNLVPYETIIRATNGEPEAVDEVLQHYSRQIRLAALENGHINKGGYGFLNCFFFRVFECEYDYFSDKSHLLLCSLSVKTELE